MNFRSFYLLVSTAVVLCNNKSSAMDSPEAHDPRSPRTAQLVSGFSPDTGSVIQDASPGSKGILLGLRERREHLSEEASNVTSDIHSPTARQIAKEARKVTLGFAISKEEEAILRKLRWNLEKQRETVAYAQMKKEGEEKEAKFRESIVQLTKRMSVLSKELNDKNTLVLENKHQIEENNIALLDSAAKLEALEQKKMDLEYALTLGGEHNEATLNELQRTRTSLEKEQKTRLILQETTETLTQALTIAREQNGADVRRLTKELAKVRTDKFRLQAQLETEQNIAQILSEGVRAATGGEFDEDFPEAEF